MSEQLSENAADIRYAFTRSKFSHLSKCAIFHVYFVFSTISLFFFNTFCFPPSSSSFCFDFFFSLCLLLSTPSISTFYPLCAVTSTCRHTPPPHSWSNNSHKAVINRPLSEEQQYQEASAISHLPLLLLIAARPFYSGLRRGMSDQMAVYYSSPSCLCLSFCHLVKWCSKMHCFKYHRTCISSHVIMSGN